MEVSTILWGGRFNAIIPLFDLAPRGWPPAPKRGGPTISALDAANGYLTAFEPDYVVEIGNCWRDGLACPDHFRKKETELPVAYREQEDLLGLTSNVAYAEEYRRRQQFVQKRPTRAVIATFRGYDLLSAAAFGTFSEGHAKTREHYQRVYSAEIVEVGRRDYWELLRDPPITPLRAGILELSFRFYSRPAIFFCNPLSPIDVIDYWNLRALGWIVVPLPERWADSTAFEEFIDSYEGEGVLLLKSFAASRRSWSNFLSRLRQRPPERLVISDVLPPMWAPRRRRHDGTWRLGCQSSDDEIEVTADKGSFRLPVASPKVAPNDRWAWQPHWVNDIELSALGDRERATKFPIIRSINTLIKYGEAAISQSADGTLAVRVKHRREREFWKLPKYEEVVQAWMNDRGIELELSSAGRIAQQMVRSLGALRLTWWVANRELIEFLNSLAHTSFEVPVDTATGSSIKRARFGTARRDHVMNVLKRVAGADYPRAKEHVRELAEKHLSFLLDKSVLRVGLKIQCLHCGQRNWYALADVAEQVKCERCLQLFAFPVARPLDADWEYRPIGPFAVEGYAQGSYAALLALRFLTFDGGSDTVWVPACELKGDGVSLECDFAAFLQEHVGSEHLTFVAGEGKSGEARFLDKDFLRCKTFAKAFPGSAFVFVTMRDAFDPAERRRIASLARNGWKAVNGRWSTPIIVLTRRELESEMGPTSMWKNAKAVVEEYRNDYRSTNMERLARATQRLYLGLDPPRTMTAE